MANKHPSVLWTYFRNPDRATAMDYLARETNKMAVPLRGLAESYEKIDWPLLVATVEGFAASLRAAITPEGRELADTIRRNQQVVFIDLTTIHQKGDH